MGFKFQGTLHSSKSYYNRALIIKSFFPQLNVIGYSQADDVLFLQRAIESISQQRSEFYGGEGGTVFRFLLARLSRISGQFYLFAHPRLLSRPHSPLIYILNQLGVTIKNNTRGVIIQGEGWKDPKCPIKLDFELSTQFASAILLSSWKLDFPLMLKMNYQSIEQIGSSQYLMMTLEMLKELGLDFNFKNHLITINPTKEIKINSIELEPDWSSLATLIVAAWINGEINVSLKKLTSFQPDCRILNIFDFPTYKFEHNQLRVTKLSYIPSFCWDFDQTPDLLPILSILASFSDGECEFRGIQRLSYKESDRLLNSKKLLKLAGVAFHESNQSWIIKGQGRNFYPKRFVFDSDFDHRMAMAAGIFQLLNKDICIKNEHVVTKSFPEFWDILRNQYD